MLTLFRSTRKHDMVSIFDNILISPLNHLSYLEFRASKTYLPLSSAQITLSILILNVNDIFLIKLKANAHLYCFAQSSIYYKTADLFDFIMYSSIKVW